MGTAAQLLTMVKTELGISSNWRAEPAAHQVNAAAAAMPIVFNENPPDNYQPLQEMDEGAKAIAAKRVVTELQSLGHDEAAAAWAVYRFVERGFLKAEMATIRITGVKMHEFDSDGPFPSQIGSYNIPQSTGPGPIVGQESESGETVEHNYLVIWPTDAFRSWAAAHGAASLSSEADGPYQMVGQGEHDGVFRWRGREIVVAGRNWDLLTCIWGHARISFADVGERVWDNDTTPPATIRTQVSRLNDHLASGGVPDLWKTDREFVIYDPPAN